MSRGTVEPFDYGMNVFNFLCSETSMRNYVVNSLIYDL